MKRENASLTLIDRRKMELNDIDFAQENIRKPYDEEMRNKTPAQMRYFMQYLANVKKSIEEAFAPEFRSDNLSKNLKETLKRQHTILMTGRSADAVATEPHEDLSYKGYMAGAPSADDIQIGIMMHEETMSQFKAAKLKLRGPDVSEIALEGPFPETIQIKGITERLLEQERAQKESRVLLFSSPLPKNTTDASGEVIHIYPRFLAKTQLIYLEQMTLLISELEELLFKDNTGVSQPKAITLISEYYHVAINAHLFERGNNSLLMSQVNYLLRFMGLKGIRHQYWDYMALINHTDDFVLIFTKAIEERNFENITS